MVCRRQIMTSKIDPRTKSKNVYFGRRPVAYRYSNKTETANQDIYDDFKLKKNFILHGLKKYISVLRVKGLILRWVNVP